MTTFLLCLFMFAVGFFAGAPWRELMSSRLPLYWGRELFFYSRDERPVRSMKADYWTRVMRIAYRENPSTPYLAATNDAGGYKDASVPLHTDYILQTRGGHLRISGETLSIMERA